MNAPRVTVGEVHHHHQCVRLGGLVQPGQSLIEGAHGRRHQAVEAELRGLRCRERGALVRGGIAEQGFAAHAAPDELVARDAIVLD